MSRVTMLCFTSSRSEPEATALWQARRTCGRYDPRAPWRNGGNRLLELLAKLREAPLQVGDLFAQLSHFLLQLGDAIVCDGWHFRRSRSGGLSRCRRWRC